MGNNVMWITTIGSTGAAFRLDLSNAPSLMPLNVFGKDCPSMIIPGDGSAYFLSKTDSHLIQFTPDGVTGTDLGPLGGVPSSGLMGAMGGNQYGFFVYGGGNVYEIGNSLSLKDTISVGHPIKDVLVSNSDLWMLSGNSEEVYYYSNPGQTGSATAIQLALTPEHFAMTNSHGLWIVGHTGGQLAVEIINAGPKTVQATFTLGSAPGLIGDVIAMHDANDAIMFPADSNLDYLGVVGGSSTVMMKLHASNGVMELDQIKGATGDADAASQGVQLYGLYHISGVVHVRLS